MERKTRRKFSREFKQEAVKLITEQHYSTSEAARNLGVGANLLRRWRQQLEDEAAGTRLNPDEREELARLRREVKTLRQEREILKKAAAFFARESG